MTETGYCVRCKQKQEMKDISIGKNAKGIKKTMGKCVKCNCNMVRFGGK